MKINWNLIETWVMILVVSLVGGGLIWNLYNTDEEHELLIKLNEGILISGYTFVLNEDWSDDRKRGYLDGLFITQKLLDPKSQEPFTRFEVGSIVTIMISAEGQNYTKTYNSFKDLPIESDCINYRDSKEICFIKWSVESVDQDGGEE